MRRLTVLANVRSAWRRATRKVTSPPLEHRRAVDVVAWSPDGRQLATGSADCTARVWDVSWDTGAPEDWNAVLERCPYRLGSDGVLIARVP